MFFILKVTNLNSFLDPFLNVPKPEDSFKQVAPPSPTPPVAQTESVDLFKGIMEQEQMYQIPPPLMQPKEISSSHDSSSNSSKYGNMHCKATVNNSVDPFFIPPLHDTKISDHEQCSAIDSIMGLIEEEEEEESREELKPQRSLNRVDRPYSSPSPVMFDRSDDHNPSQPTLPMFDNNNSVSQQPQPPPLAEQVQENRQVDHLNDDFLLDEILMNSNSANQKEEQDMKKHLEDSLLELDSKQEPANQSEPVPVVQEPKPAETIQPPSVPVAAPTPQALQVSVAPKVVDNSSVDSQPKPIKFAIAQKSQPLAQHTEQSVTPVHQPTLATAVKSTPHPPPPPQNDFFSSLFSSPPRDNSKIVKATKSIPPMCAHKSGPSQPTHPMPLQVQPVPQPPPPSLQANHENDQDAAARTQLGDDLAFLDNLIAKESNRGSTGSGRTTIRSSLEEELCINSMCDAPGGPETVKPVGAAVAPVAATKSAVPFVGLQPTARLNVAVKSSNPADAIKPVQQPAAVPVQLPVQPMLQQGQLATPVPLPQLVAQQPIAVQPQPIPAPMAAVATPVPIVAQQPPAIQKIQQPPQVNSPKPASSPVVAPPPAATPACTPISIQSLLAGQAGGPNAPRFALNNGQLIQLGNLRFMAQPGQQQQAGQAQQGQTLSLMQQPGQRPILVQNLQQLQQVQQQQQQNQQQQQQQILQLQQQGNGGGTLVWHPQLGLTQIANTPQRPQFVQQQPPQQQAIQVITLPNGQQIAIQQPQPQLMQNRPMFIRNPNPNGPRFLQINPASIPGFQQQQQQQQQQLQARPQTIQIGPNGMIQIPPGVQLTQQQLQQIQQLQQQHQANAAAANAQSTKIILETKQGSAVRDKVDSPAPPVEQAKVIF